MNKQEIENKVNQIRKGTFTRIVYKTDLPVRAEFKNDYTIYKVVETTVRIGVKYDNIKAVQRKEAERTEPKKEHKYPYSSIIPNILYRHESGQEYLQFATVRNNANAKTKYYLSESDGKTREFDKSSIKELGYVRNSYWSEHEVPEVQKIKLENIIKL